MNAEHTAEPWTLSGHPGYAAAVVFDGRGYMICNANIFAPNTRSQEGNNANARRIAAAVNACKGIPTAILEALVREPTAEEDLDAPTTIREVCEQATQTLYEVDRPSFQALDALAGDYDDMEEWND